MNGPPRQKEAARILVRSEAAEDRNAERSLGGDDGECKRVLGDVQMAPGLGETPR